MSGRGPQQLQQQFGRQLVAGEVIFQQGDRSTETFLLQAGRVELIREGSRDKGVFRVVQPGDIFGISALLGGRRRTATARCSMTGMALAMTSSTFLQALQSDPDVAARVIRQVLRRMRSAESRVETLLLNDDGARVLSALAAAAKGPELSADGTFTLPPATLARSIGLDIRVVRQYVTALCGDGYLSIKDERIRVDDVPRLLHLRDGLAADSAAR